MEEKIKSYKGFNKDMTCLDFQYEQGKEYETEDAKACDYGFHACEYPLDCLGYYNPAESVYHEVEQSGKLSRKGDATLLSSTKIKIGVEISIAGMVKAAIEYIRERAKESEDAHNTGYRGASSNTGDCGASSNTGYRGASSNTGDYGASSNTGDYGASSNTGDCGASSNTGDCGASSNTGYRGASSNTGDYGASSNTGNCGASSNTGYRGAAEANHPNSVAVAWGPESKAKGVKGATLVFAEWESNGGVCWEEETWTFKGSMMVRVDGERIKEDAWYTMRSGEIVEAER